MKTYQALLFAAGMALATPVGAQELPRQKEQLAQWILDTQVSQNNATHTFYAEAVDEVATEMSKKYTLPSCHPIKYFLEVSVIDRGIIGKADDQDILIVNTNHLDNYATPQPGLTGGEVQRAEYAQCMKGRYPEDIGQQGDIEFTIGAPTNNSIHTYAEAKYMSDTLLIMLKLQYEQDSVHSLSRKSKFTSKACVQQLKKRFPNLR